MTKLHSVDCQDDARVTSWEIGGHGTLSRTYFLRLISLCVLKLHSTLREINCLKPKSIVATQYIKVAISNKP